MHRSVAYAVAAVVILFIDLPVWRAAVFAILSAVMAGAAVYRLVTRRAGHPYVLAQIDHVVATLAIAVATASPMFTLGLGLLIAVLNTVSFVTPPKLALTLAAFCIGPGLAAAFLISRGGSNDASASAAFFILQLTTVTILVVAYFAYQSRQLRLALSRREREIESVLGITPVLLATVDNGRVTMLAGNCDGWQGDPATQLSESTEIQGILKVASRGERVRQEATVADRALSVTCEPGDDGTLLLTAYDVTAQVEARRRLEDLVRSKDQFITGVSHELRTPLTSVLGFSEILQESIPDEDLLQPLLGEVVGQSAEMAAIIDDLLVAGRSSFDTVAINPRSIEVTEEIRAVADSIAIRVTAPVEYDLQPAVAVADPIRVRQVIRNLITNADRYGGEAIRVCSHAEQGEVVVQVRDSGPPIPVGMRRRIFDPYVSAGSVEGQPASIGLGLAVSHTLAELMGGSVVYHHDGDWSIFELRLPRAGAHIALGT